MSLATVQALSTSGLVNYMSPDREVRMKGHLENTTGTTQIRSQSPGYGRTHSYTLDGAGVGIAIVDSGIATGLKSFSDGYGNSRVVFSKSFIAGNTSTNDVYGHGTHVASIAAGSSNRAGGAYRGIAPKADLINLRVLNDDGIGTTSALLNAIEWLRLNHSTYNIRVANMSLGTPAVDSMYNDPLCYAVQDLNLAGVLVVAAAGNDGKTANSAKVYGQIHSPGNDPSVLTVGATNTFGTDTRSDDVMASYSSHGPTRSYFTDAAGNKHYDHVIKPDVVAPGNKIIGASAPSNRLLTINPSLSNLTLNTFGTDNDMMYQSGTSMSAPVVTGSAALLFQLNPKLTRRWSRCSSSTRHSRLMV
jgi:subtilisin family serine protease